MDEDTTLGALPPDDTADESTDDVEIEEDDADIDEDEEEDV